MYIVTLTYVAPLKHVDRFIPDHIAFLEKHFSKGHFQLSGRINPRTGGVILATVESRETLDMILAEDPFYREKLAKYDVVEVVPSKASSRLEFLLES